ncbi:hypothetical protein FOZ62_022308 [Perkinsus olseni]|uniref:Acyltransferase n=1 Tax=Perkinsus olseni TaxID=32597 RepID=A0A7J6UEN3_PEROL|nr:hypothetical protein FOZ62_022308 [Perkinsus olseni]
MRRLFKRVSFILEDEKAVNSLPKVVYCAHPHGVVPFIHPFLVSKVKHKVCPLGARVLFKLPIMREISLWYGAIDANKETALEALRRGYSISIVIGGTREQMIPYSSTHDTVVCKTRMGYAKLAYAAGRVPIVPSYCFGQSIAHDTGTFMLTFRQRVQRALGVALPFPKSLLPKHLEDFAIVVGKPLLWEDGDTPETMHRKSFFGPPASMDFCEDNYAHSDHVAEFFNSLSSAYIISIGLIGLFLCSPKAGNEARYKLYYGLIALVGLGSVAFHGTLRQYAQALDELPMLWGGLTTLWISLFYHAPDGDASARQWAWGFVGFGAALTALYLSTWRIYMIFLATYALAVAGATILASYRCYRHQGPSRAIAWRLLEVALWINLASVSIWWLENMFCEQLKPFYLHATAWHTLSATAAHFFAQGMVAMRADAVSSNCRLNRVYKVFPVVSYKSNAVKPRAAIDNLGKTLLGGTVRVEESTF